MKRYHFPAVMILMCFFSPSAPTADTIDVLMGADGAKRFRIHSVYSGKRFSVGGSAVYAIGGSLSGMAGLNTKLLTLGHLGDAGLLSEARNPGYEALSRLTERTMLRANLFSPSLSRFGLAFTPWEGRAGVAWERRGDVDAGIIWAVPLSTKNWSVELLGEAGLVTDSKVAQTWYIKKSGRPVGPFALIAGRVRYHPPKWDVGLTSMVSGGRAYRPGVLGALAMNYSGGAWKIRLRGVYSSPYFRTADGERLDAPWGFAVDGRYKPKTGFQGMAAYRFAAKRGDFGLLELADTASLSVGWRFQSVLVTAHSDWNRAFMPTADFPLKRLTGTVGWEMERAQIRLSATWRPHESWTAQLNAAFPARKTWLLETGVKIHRERGPVLADLSIKGRWTVKKSRFTVAAAFRDLPKAWTPGPASAGAMDVSLRWNMSLGN